MARVLLLTFQLSVAGCLYMLVAIPALMLVSGLLYALVVATEMVLAAVAVGLSEVVVSALPPLFPSMSASAGGTSLLVTIGSALSQAASALTIIATPFMIALALNIVCGFLAPYRGWYKKLRRLAIIGNVAVLACYLLPQVLVVGFLLSGGSRDGPAVSFGGVMLVASAFLIWDSYFLISLVLMYCMRERTETARMARYLPRMVVGLCIVLVIGFGTILFLLGAHLGAGAIIAACILLCLSALLLLADARATKRIAVGGGKLFTVLVLLLNLAAALLCLFLVPPVGVLILLSLTFLYFMAETVFLAGRTRAGEFEPAAYPAAPAE